MNEAFDKWWGVWTWKQEDAGIKATVESCWKAATPQWQPIETAPKDGTEILGFNEDNGGIFLARYTCLADFLSDTELERYDEEKQFRDDWFHADFVCGGLLEGDEIPTHWQPLPEPPKQ